MRRIELLFLLILRSSALSIRGPDIPSFNWISDQHQRSSPQLRVEFTDGSHDTIIFHDVEEFSTKNGPTCLMRGTFEKDQTVRVALTGGCANSSDFEMTIVGSQKLQHSAFVVSKGITEPLGPPKRHNWNLFNEAPTSEKNITRQSPLAMPKKYRVNLQLHADKNFIDKYTDEESARLGMRKIVLHTEAWFLHDSLGTQFQLIPSISYKWKYPKTLYPSELAKTNSYVYETYIDGSRVNAKIFFGAAYWYTMLSGGKAYRSLICSYINNVAIVLHEDSEVWTGQALAHEIGHLLGLKHDYFAFKFWWRWDSQRNLCTYQGGVMDVHWASTWTSCSREDLQKSYEENNLRCLQVLEWN